MSKINDLAIGIGFLMLVRTSPIEGRLGGAVFFLVYVYLSAIFLNSYITSFLTEETK